MLSFVRLFSIFKGMLFSLREVAASLSPESSKEKGGLQLIRTGAATLHTYETTSGHRLALYVTDDNSQGIHANSIRRALIHIYHELWIQCVTRSPLYRPTAPNVEDTNFPVSLQEGRERERERATVSREHLHSTFCSTHDRMHTPSLTCMFRMFFVHLCTNFIMITFRANCNFIWPINLGLKGKNKKKNKQ